MSPEPSAASPTLAAPRTADRPETPPPLAGEPRETFGSIMQKLGAVGPLAVISAILPPLGGFTLLYFSQPVAEWLRSHGDVGPYVYVLGFTLLAGLALLPTYAQALLGGYAFGVLTGSVAALAGFVGAASLAYGIARLVAGQRVPILLAQHPRWNALYQELLRRGFWRTLGIVALLRLPPNSPFAITNLVLSAARVNWLSYALGTLLGMAPRTVAAVYVGSTFSTFTGREEVPWSLKIAGIVMSLIVLGVIGWVANRALQRIAGVTPAAANHPAQSP